MLRQSNGVLQACCRNETNGFMNVNDAIARARAHSPFLAMQLELRPQVAEKLAREGLAAALAAADEGGEEVMAAVRRTRSGHALALGLADLAHIVTLEELLIALSDLADRLIERALKAAVAERSPGESPKGFAILGLGKLGGRELNY